MKNPPALRQSQFGELDTLVIENDKARVELSLYGAQVLSFVPKKDGRERLWLSPHADLSGNKPIRGGIPLCWPWFGNDTGRNDDTLPSHGYLRTQYWTLKQFDDSDGSASVVLAPSVAEYEGIDDKWDVLLKITVSDSLEVSLTTTNIGSKEAKFNAALHSYFNVDQIAECQLEGLSGKYKDKLDDWALKPTPQPYGIVSETDRIHLCTPSQTTIKNDNNQVSLQHGGHDSIVVWNPWSSAAWLADMDAFGYKHMICVETAVTQWKTMAKGESHTLTQTID